ncbi:MAG: DUF2147 domain-containing protein [Flavobacteriales bacterium]|nr:DUF2147 domain-containing protein [Flavobacteriales bacterium]
MNKRFFFFSVCMTLASLVSAQSLTGRWKTIDDENAGRVKSIVEISEQDGMFHGTVVELFRLPDEDQDPYCDKCGDDRKDKRVLGMQIVRDMKAEVGEWDDGTICDPKNGKVYGCKMWFEEGDPNTLKVRGYWGFIYRTQEWIRQ